MKEVIYSKFNFASRHLQIPLLLLGLSLSIVQVGYTQKISNQNTREVKENYSIGLDLIKVSSTESEYYESDKLSTPPIEIDWDWKAALLDEPNYFEEKSSIVQFGIGFLSTVNLKERAAELDLIDAEFFIPSLHIMYERQVWKNVGAGISFGTQVWKVPILEYQYRYYTLGLRAAYHFTIIDKLDPYLALGTTFRRMVLANSDRNIANSKMTFHLVIGSRYYFTERIGAHLEIGNDMTSWFKIGASYYIY